MDLLILLTYDLIFMINNIVLPYLVMTEPFLDILQCMDGQFWCFVYLLV